MFEPTYKAATAAANRIQRYLTESPQTSGAMAPDAATVATLINAAFWTSLLREEIYTPRISFAFVSPDLVTHPLSFSTSIALEPRELTKLAAAVERSGIHLCVWPTPEGLRVWGIARQLPPLSLVLEIVIPGLLVVKRSPVADGGKFLNLAVLHGDDVKFIDQRPEPGLEVPDPLASLLHPATQFRSGRAVNLLLQLAVSMRAHGRGGMLLVIPGGSDAWKESVLHPITYAITPPFSGLADLMRRDGAAQAGRKWEEALARVVDGIAGFTAVDGATVITSEYDLLAFGAKIIRRKRARQVSRVIVTEPVEGGIPVLAEPAQLGGTRHLAAAQFVQDQRDAIALVASQDGRFTVFGWSTAEDRVHAHRIDVLLL
jgi:hypothetical protein